MNTRSLHTKLAVGSLCVLAMTSALAPAASASIEFSLPQQSVAIAQPYDIAVFSGRDNAAPLKDAVTRSDANLNDDIGIAFGKPAPGFGFNSAAAMSVNGGSPRQFGAGNVIGDQHIDLVVPIGGGAVDLYSGLGNGVYAAPVTYTPPAAINGTSGEVGIADVNGDHKNDIVLLSGINSKVLVYTRTGASFTATSYPVTGQPADVAFGEFNNKRGTDFVVPLWNNGPNGDVSIFTNKGDGTFNVGTYPSGVISPTSVTAGDFNKDGKGDFALGSFLGGTGGVNVVLGSGGGAFQASVHLDYPMNASGGPSDIAAFDADGDGDLDIATADSDNGIGNPNGTVTVYANSGNGAPLFGGPMTTPTAGADPSAMAVSDVNIDGRPDLVVAENASNSTSVLYNLST